MNMNREQVAGDLKAFVVGAILNGKDSGLDAKTPILELGIIQSFSLAQMMAHIREEFGVVIPSSEWTPTNLATLDAITDLVMKYSAESASVG